MGWIVDLIREYGLGVVFLNVLIEQLGAPIPAYPVLLVTAAVLGSSAAHILALVAVGVLAALIADVLWYHLGKMYGQRVLGAICRISLSPDACIRQTESLYGRWGAKSLLIAKFVPGFASIASALAGVMGTPLRTFVLYDGLGALLWVGSAVFLGSLFSTTVEDLLAVLTALGQWGLLLLGVALAVFIARKWWQRHRVVRSLRMPRMTVQELARLYAQGTPPTVIDVRAPELYHQGHIPGAQAWGLRPRRGAVPHAHLLPHEDHAHGLVMYCDCPHEISAARLARQLRRAGFGPVWPLQGGLEAWKAAGLELQQASAAQAPAPAGPEQALNNSQTELDM